MKKKSIKIIQKKFKNSLTLNQYWFIIKLIKGTEDMGNENYKFKIRKNQKLQSIQQQG